jgi:hypothetical protein
MSLFDENAGILRGMANDGSDLGPSRRVDFAHVFPDLASAEAFAATAAHDGFETAVEKVDRDNDPWDVIASKDMVPSAENITMTEERLDGLARARGGMSDGWGFLRV